MKNFISSWMIFIFLAVLVLSLPARIPFLKKILVGDEVRHV